MTQHNKAWNEWRVVGAFVTIFTLTLRLLGMLLISFAERTEAVLHLSIVRPIKT